MIFPAIAIAAAYLPGLLYENTKSKWQGNLLLIIIIVCMVLTGVKAGGWKKLYKNNSAHLALVHQRAGVWARENLPDDARIACFDIGSLKFFSQRYVIDLGGLTDPSIHPFLENKRVGRYLLNKGATHYIEMDRHSSDKLTGVKGDEGRLYNLKEPKRFDAKYYDRPVFMHSLGMVIYEIEYMED